MLSVQGVYIMEIKELIELLHQYMDENYIEKKERRSLFFGKSRSSSRKNNEIISEEQIEHYEGASSEPAFYSSQEYGRPEPSVEYGNFRGKESSRPTEEMNSASLEDYLNTNYSSVGVAQKLNRYMYERDINTKMIYERCFIDRKLISKIAKGNYHPSKRTMLLLCIGLQLSVEEGEEFLRLAGYSFSNNDRMDLIIRFALKLSCYSLDAINEMLYEYNLQCIGA